MRSRRFAVLGFGLLGANFLRRRSQSFWVCHLIVTYSTTPIVYLWFFGSSDTNRHYHLTNIALMWALVPGFEMRISSALIQHSIYTTCTHSFAGCVGRWIQQVGSSLLIALRPLFEENLDNQLGGVFHHPS